MLGAGACGGQVRFWVCMPGGASGGESGQNRRLGPRILGEERELRDEDEDGEGQVCEEEQPRCLVVGDKQSVRPTSPKSWRA
jgi:hypothetical protein